MEQTQKQLCEQYGSKYEPLQEGETIIFAGEDFLKLPVIGCRVEDWSESGSLISKWFVSCGDVPEDCPERELSLGQIAENLPQIMPYLALEKGFNFIIDEENEADVWFDD